MHEEIERTEKCFAGISYLALLCTFSYIIEEKWQYWWRRIIKCLSEWCETDSRDGEKKQFHAFGD